MSYTEKYSMFFYLLCAIIFRSLFDFQVFCSEICIQIRLPSRSLACSLARLFRPICTKSFDSLIFCSKERIGYKTVLPFDVNSNKFSHKIQIYLDLHKSQNTCATLGLCKMYLCMQSLFIQVILYDFSSTENHIHTLLLI